MLRRSGVRQVTEHALDGRLAVDAAQLPFLTRHHYAIQACTHALVYGLVVDKGIELHPRHRACIDLRLIHDRLHGGVYQVGLGVRFRIATDLVPARVVFRRLEEHVAILREPRRESVGLLLLKDTLNLR